MEKTDDLSIWPSIQSQDLIANVSERVNFFPGDLSFALEHNVDVEDFVEEVRSSFQLYMYMTHPKYVENEGNPYPDQKSCSAKITVHLNVTEHKSVVLDVTDTDESYSLNIQKRGSSTEVVSVVDVLIQSKSYFGARHGIESLSQLIRYDEITDSMTLYSSISFEDFPAYRHRGVMISTGSHFLKTSTIKRVGRCVTKTGAKFILSLVEIFFKNSEQIVVKPF